MFQAIKNYFNPQTKTVQIFLNGGKDHCEVTYIANNEETKHKIDSMVKNGNSIYQANLNNPSISLLETEKELGLKRHFTRDKQGRRLPGFQTIRKNGANISEYWRNGKEMTFHGIHRFETYGSAITPFENDGFMPVKDEGKKQNFIASYKTYYGIPALA